MKKAKIVIKQKEYDDNGLVYTTNCKGEAGICFTMALGTAVSIAKQNGISMTKITSILKDIYKETEDNENGKN